MERGELDRYDWKYMGATVIKGKHERPSESLLEYVLKEKKEMDDEINKAILKRINELEEGEDGA